MVTTKPLMRCDRAQWPSSCARMATISGIVHACFKGRAGLLKLRVHDQPAGNTRSAGICECRDQYRTSAPRSLQDFCERGFCAPLSPSPMCLSS